VHLFSQDGLENEGYFSIKNRLAFGNNLYYEKDYLRALNELKEVLKYKIDDTTRFIFSECFLRIGRYDEASDNFKGLFFNSHLKDEARLAFFSSEFHKENFSEFRMLTKQENYFSQKYKTEINRLYYISHFLDNSVLPDSAILFSAFPDSNKMGIKNFYLRKKFPEYKSPATAALLSSIIPGLGKIYTGEVSDGITSLLVTGLLTFLSIDNFNHNHKFRGWLFAGLTAFSYAGTIYGSAASAQIFNAGIKFSFEHDVKIYFEKRNYFLPDKYF
jgi:TM2 domain-containing membrane protein YozV